MIGAQDHRGVGRQGPQHLADRVVEGLEGRPGSVSHPLADPRLVDRPARYEVLPPGMPEPVGENEDQRE